MNELQDSINTAIDMNLFKNRETASVEHIFNHKLIKIPIFTFFNVDNFDPILFTKDISVKYHQNKDSPIWLIYKNKRYILLDGEHKIVANYIEGKRFINAYVIKL